MIAVLRFGALPIISVCLTLWHVTHHTAPEWQFAPYIVENTSQDAARFEQIFEYKSPNGTAHSPAIRPSGDEFSLIWFDGTRESHNDVAIYQSAFHTENDHWVAGQAKPLFTREALIPVSAPRQTVLTLGNTIAGMQDPKDLFATIVSAGGWAASSIASVRLENGTPIAMRKLSLSPFLNRSYLVKSPTIAYQDGTVAIPAYFEMGNAFGELVRLNKYGRVSDKRRISQGRFGIQPELVVLDDKNALALLRNFDDESDRLLASRTQDGGQSWSDVELLDLPNPNSPVAAILLSTGRILLVFNDSPTDASILRMAVSDDKGHTWRRIYTLEEGDGSARYPMMRALPGGDIILVYSNRSKQGIKAFAFNEAWVLAQ